MTRRRFQPQLWSTVASLVAFLALIGLGTWQLERREWKRGLVERIEGQLAAAPQPLPAAIPAEAAPSWDFRPVAVTGRFDHARELHWQARTRDGQLGVELIVPLLREGSAPVLVNRGWVPLDRRDPATRPETLPQAEVTVTGVARQPVEPGWMQPENRAAGNQWFWLDLPAMATAAGVPQALPILVQAAPGQGGAALPVPRPVRPDLPNNHFQYALTWYGLAAALAAIYVVFHLRPVQAGGRER